MTSSTNTNGIPLNRLNTTTTTTTTTTTNTTTGNNGRARTNTNTTSTPQRKRTATTTTTTTTRPPLQRTMGPDSLGNIYSFTMLSWLNPLLRRGLVKGVPPLGRDDLYTLKPSMSSYTLISEFDSFWWAMEEVRRGAMKPSLLNTILYPIRSEVIWMNWLELLFVLLSNLITPLLLNQMISYFDPTDTSQWLLTSSPWILGGALVGSQLVEALLGSATSVIALGIDQKISAMIMSNVYKKSFRLSHDARKTYSSGRIINMINKDCQNLAGVFSQFFALMAALVGLAITLVFLFYLLGITALVPLGFSLLSILGAISCEPVLSSSIDKWFVNKDLRISKVREALHGMEVIKFRGLEDIIKASILFVREAEVAALKKFTMAAVLTESFSGVLPLIIALVSFPLYIYLGNPFQASVIFTSLALFSLLISPLTEISEVVIAMVMLAKEWERVADYMSAEEIDPDNLIEKSQFRSDFAIQLENVSWQTGGDANGVGGAIVPEWWNDDEAEMMTSYSLDAISAKIKKGQHVAVIGPVGSGKSALLAALIGDVKKLGGNAYVSGTLAYSAEQPMILQSSISKNIVFGSEFNRQRLGECVTACALDNDLSNMEDGIDTAVGEYGVDLSGGQKARISLARALYRDADIYLLDSPLAALDSAVGKRVFNNVVKGRLQGKTLLYATHQLHLLPEFDMIMYLDQGKLVEFGTYKELINKRGGAVAKMVKQYNVLKAVEKNKEGNLAKPDVYDTALPGTGEGVLQKVLEDEDREEGIVGLNAYSTYLHALGGWPVAAFYLHATICWIAANVWSQIWLTIAAEKDVITLGEFAPIFFIASGIAIIAELAVSISLPFVALYGSVVLHDAALESIFRAPISFFERNPVGRVLNRFSFDVGTTDGEMYEVMATTFFALTSTISGFILVAYSSWYMIVAIVSLFGFYFLMFRIFQPANRDLRRLNSILKSPMDSHISESLAALNLVKAFELEDHFLQKHQECLDDYLRSSYMEHCLGIWINVRLTLSTSLLTGIIVIVGITVPSVSPAALGLGLSSGISLAADIFGLLTALAETESEMVSIERLSHYADNLPNEGPEGLAIDPPKGLWPSLGKVEFRNVSIAYPSRPNRKVIDDLTLSLVPGEKIALVGRTGSGKSSLANALFRMVEASNGSILIDNVDISEISVNALRKSGGIEMIPQHPILFEGTLRSNLDPYNSFLDSECWNALSMVGLKDQYEENELKLLTGITAGGGNMSLGERQLLCLARALLAKPKILVMDEATAALDRKADALIQAILFTKFPNTTVISIAHRLTTISKYDRVVVMSYGHIIELGSPKQLLEDQTSHFYMLSKGIAESGGTGGNDTVVGSLVSSGVTMKL